MADVGKKVKNVLQLVNYLMVDRQFSLNNLKIQIACKIILISGKYHWIDIIIL